MRYISLADLKTHLGITGTSTDDYLKMEIKASEDRLDALLSVNRLDIHMTSDERHDATGVSTLYLKDLHVVEIGEILDDTTAYTQDDAYDIDNYVLHLDGSLTSGRRNAHVDYAAGWNAGGIAKLTVSDYSSITGVMTLDVDPAGSDPNVLTEGTDWDAETSNNVTATNIANAINTAAKTDEDTATGIRAFALEAVVYIVDETAGRQTSTVTASAVGGLSLVSGGGTAGAVATALTMDGKDLPQDLIEGVVHMVGSKFNQRKSQGVKSYKIGSKSVTYSNGDLTAEVKSIIKPHMRASLDIV